MVPRKYFRCGPGDCFLLSPYFSAYLPFLSANTFLPDLLHLSPPSSTLGKEAEKMLESARNGLFLVRSSQSKPGDYVLSVRARVRVRVRARVRARHADDVVNSIFLN